MGTGRMPGGTVDGLRPLMARPFQTCTKEGKKQLTGPRRGPVGQKAAVADYRPAVRQCQRGGALAA
ncbi:hypothetical protein BURKHO8Y_110086 [Burkholderia sp. 8Y]|nr:hypothetical protein BURKHO8Y_110086 [Burkholderia sp. 8Y]